MINKLGMQETLCWSCAHAVPEEKKGRGCSWSLDFQPVRGCLLYTSPVLVAQGRDFLFGCNIESLLAERVSTNTARGFEYNRSSFVSQFIGNRI